jgi:hypothetical protein
VSGLTAASALAFWLRDTILAHPAVLGPGSLIPLALIAHITMA